MARNALNREQSEIIDGAKEDDCLCVCVCAYERVSECKFNLLVSIRSSWKPFIKEATLLPREHHHTCDVLRI